MPGADSPQPPPPLARAGARGGLADACTGGAVGVRCSLPGTAPAHPDGPPERQREGLILAPQGTRDPACARACSIRSGARPGWGCSSFLPPLFWLTSLPLISVVAAPAVGQLSASTRFGVMFPDSRRAVLRAGAGLHAAVPGPGARGSSALGEVHHPRWPELGPGGDAPGGLPLVLGRSWSGSSSGSSPRWPTGSIVAISTRSTWSSSWSCSRSGRPTPRWRCWRRSCTTTRWGPTRSP